MFTRIDVQELEKYVVGTKVYYGNYGRQFQVDEDGEEIEDKVVTEKRGRGRPKKYINACQMRWDPLLDKAACSWAKLSAKGK